MATNEGLNLKIGATVDELLKGISDAKKAMADLSTATNNEANAADAAGKKWNQMGKYIFQLNYERKRMLQQVQQGIGVWKLEARAVDEVANKSLPGLQRGTRGATSTLTSFGRIVQDAPYGIIGIGNNITQFAEQFQYLRQKTGSAGGALKALGSSLVGAGGLTLGISLLITGITTLVQKYGSLGNAITQIFDTLSEAEKRQKALRDAIEGSADAYQDAVSMVEELKTNIDLAKKGLIDKEKVVNQYNKSIGKTTGSVKNLDEAEKALVKNADAYIKFTLLKAAAQLALDEAAKKAFEAELKRQKEAREFVAFSDRSFSSTAQFGGLDAKTAEKLRKERGEIRKKEAIKESEDARKIFEDIAKKLQSDAAAISSKYQFDFFGGDQDEKSKKKVKTIAEVLKTLEKEMRAIAEYNELVGYSVDKLAEEKLSSLNKAFEDIAKIGGPGARKELEKIRKEIDLVSASILGDKGIKSKQILSFDKMNIKDPISGLSNERIVARIPIDISLTNVNQAIADLNAGLVPIKNTISNFDSELTKQIGDLINNTVVKGIGNVAGAIGEAIAGGGIGTVIQSFVNTISGFLTQLGELLIAQGITLEAFKKSLSTFQGIPAIIAGAGLIAAATAFKSFAGKGLSSFATGGAVFQPTMAMIGDNPGREEYVIPSEVLDKLGRGGGYPSEVTLRAHGTDLVGVLKMGQIQNGRING